jgi:hypothetical protein
MGITVFHPWDGGRRVVPTASLDERPVKQGSPEEGGRERGRGRRPLRHVASQVAKTELIAFPLAHRVRLLEAVSPVPPRRDVTSSADPKSHVTFD